LESKLFAAATALSTTAVSLADFAQFSPPAGPPASKASLSPVAPIEAGIPARPLTKSISTSR
jgi:hypothetical protein